MHIIYTPTYNIVKQNYVHITLYCIVSIIIWMDRSLLPRKKIFHYTKIDKTRDWIVNFKTITETWFWVSGFVHSITLISDFNRKETYRISDRGGQPLTNTSGWEPFRSTKNATGWENGQCGYTLENCSANQLVSWFLDFNVSSTAQGHLGTTRVCENNTTYMYMNRPSCLFNNISVWTK